MPWSLRVLAAIAPIVVLTGCGAAQPSSQGQRQWRANAVELIAQLRADEGVAAEVPGSVPAARSALRSDSQLFALLVTYTDFGGCARMVSSAGVPTRKFVAAQAALSLACGHLARAATLFTRAASDTDARALVAAGRQAGEAAPLLVRARLDLARAAS